MEGIGLIFFIIVILLIVINNLGSGDYDYWENHPQNPNRGGRTKHPPMPEWGTPEYHKWCDDLDPRNKDKDVK